MPFETDNGTGTVTISGSSAVSAWFADPGLSGDTFPLPLGDVDVAGFAERCGRCREFLVFR